MKNVCSKIWWLMLVVAVACREKYLPQVTSTNTKYLVVEGFINVGDVPTTITLTNTVKLSDKPQPAPVTGATVKVQCEDGSSYNLAPVTPGVYTISAINGNTAAKYRLYIAVGGKEYLSDYTANKATPAIDSVSWQQKDDGVHIYANTHDPAGNTRYYQWDFVETYEYHAAFNAYFKLVNNAVAPRSFEESLYRCWHTLNSTRLLTFSTTKLAEDVVYKNEVQFIPASTVKIGVMYSMLLSQRAITQEAYNYVQQMSKNTESLGSLFDAQPSLLRGNIHCVTDASEIVVGFITTGSVQQKRIFIARRQLTGWSFPPDPYRICDTVHLDGIIDRTRFDQGYVPVDYWKKDSMFASTTNCTDCRLEGGTLTKPDFWP